MDLLNYKFICAGLTSGVENIERASNFGVWQGFPNSVKGWREREIFLGGFLLAGWWGPEEWFGQLELFLKANNIIL